MPLLQLSVKHLILLLLLSGMSISCKRLSSSSQPSVHFVIEKTYPLTTSVRALEVVDDQTVWFAGSKGQYGYTEDGGAHWIVDSIQADTLVPHFRAISVTDEAVFLLSIASPALLYRSADKGQNWDIVYREGHPQVFYDAMAFWDQQEGLAMGDPTDGCLSVVVTRDGGRTWQKLPCDRLSATEEGEAAFAASNSNLALYGNHVWMVSGGKKARVFHSGDRGASWEVFETPIIQGGSMTGIFTVDFWDENNGVIFGGDWEDKGLNTGNKARTTDGGRTWQLIADGKDPGYRSCVQYIPESKGRELLTVGIPGISSSSDQGDTWVSLSGESYYTVRLSGPNVAWIAGDQKISRMVRK